MANKLFLLLVLLTFGVASCTQSGTPLEDEGNDKTGSKYSGKQLVVSSSCKGVPAKTEFTISDAGSVTSPASSSLSTNTVTKGGATSAPDGSGGGVGDSSSGGQDISPGAIDW